MSQIDHILQEIDVLPPNDLIYLWETVQNKVKQLFMMQLSENSKRPYALCKGEFSLSKFFFEPLPIEMSDLFEGREK